MILVTEIVIIKEAIAHCSVSVNFARVLPLDKTQIHLKKNKQKISEPIEVFKYKFGKVVDKNHEVLT